MEADSAEDLQQFRINFGEGLTPTERLLKHLGERSFLRFWSHANPHVTPTQELCDLLVVCGDYVIIFSDKSNSYQSDTVEPVAWRRWYRRAITKSTGQISGAIRHLFHLQTPIFKDRTCTIPIGLPIPSKPQAKIYRVVVVSDSKDVDEATPLRPLIGVSAAVVGDQHTADGAMRFTIGDVSPHDDFVHVFDVAGLSETLQQLDTVTDFARYLDARRAFMRGQFSNSAQNERCLLTRYLLSFTDAGDQLPIDSSAPGHTHLDDAEWQSNDAKLALESRTKANSDSYLWDFIVERQALLIERQGFGFSNYRSVAEGERVVRHMALEHRLNRRLLARAWKTACLTAAPGQTANIRTVPHNDNSMATYVFFTLKRFSELSEPQYRELRLDALKKMVLASLIDFPASSVIIGIASELGRSPKSYDLLHFNIAEDAVQEALWTDAKTFWEMKKQAFEDPKFVLIDERDIPPVD